MKNKKGVGGIEFLAPIMIALAIAGVVAVVALTITDDTTADLVTGTAGCNATVTTNCGAAYNASLEGQQGLTNTTSRVGLIGTVAGFGIVLGVLAFFLGRKLLGF